MGNKSNIDVTAHAKCGGQAGAAAARELNDYGHPMFMVGPTLANEVRTHVATPLAAFWLNRKEQTLRMWACYENGPLRPARINGRLAWSVAEIRRLLGHAGS